MSGRDTTAAFLTEIANGTIEPHILVDAEFTSGTVYVWTGDYDLVWNSNTYLGTGNLLGIADVVESVEVETSEITISFEGISSAYKTLALSQVELSNQVTVRLALIGSSGSVIADPETLFQGTMDDVNISEGSENSTFTLTVQNKLAVLNSPNERRYTLQDRQQLYPSDTFFRHMVNSEKPTKWGSGL